MDRSGKAGRSGAALGITRSHLNTLRYTAHRVSNSGHSVGMPLTATRPLGQCSRFAQFRMAPSRTRYTA